MWKIKIIFVNIVIVLFFMASNLNSFALEIPKYIKVGMKYGQSALSTYTLNSSNGFNIINIDGDYSENITTLDSTLLKTKKDEYHILVNDSYSNLYDALSLKKELEALNLKSYIYYDGKYSVYVDSFSSNESAQSYLKTVSQSFTNYNLKVVSPKTSVIQLMDKNSKVVFAYDSSKDVGIESMNADVITVDNKKYRGSIILKKNNSISMINRITVDDYLYGVLPKEMSSSWPTEALKAQAVAARNYAIMNINKKHVKEGFDLCTTTHCQVYGGYESEGANSNKAVDLTTGEVMTYNGELVEALYHSNSGGRTEDSENVWSSKVDYLRGVEDSYSIGYPNDNWTVSMTKQEVKNKLSQNKVNIGDIVDVRISEVSPNGRAIKLDFIGTTGEKSYTKDSIRSVLGLKSTYFDINGQSVDNGSSNKIYMLSNDSTLEANLNQSTNIISSDKTYNLDSLNGLVATSDNNSTTITAPKSNSSVFVFNGHGWGHGIGMSQWGAKKMAEIGKTYEDILKHYYTGVKINR